MIGRKISTNLAADVTAVIDRERGIATTTAYLNHVLREYFTQQGLLPEVPA